MIYRIITEDKDRSAVIQLTAGYFDGFSVKTQMGYWQGQPESSIVIEIDNIADDAQQESKIMELTRCIIKRNNQQAILVQRIQSDSELVWRS